ncbi:hypothetical protein Cgig2_027521 [Carnegiea gigantea]|uniref:Uncharacterized protein n=1 Tax=Carnegiea gigantea TaxID=171969 RepID=A0A9Q1GNR1_9CARY|nr:hypothetical protein Cgig2_027521 [Carnegiea gigantea]
MDGSCGSRRASLENGDESSHDLIYRRSSSLKTLIVRKGTLSYSYNDEKSCINTYKGYVNFFDAMVLEKVNMESNGDGKFLVTPSFCPTLHKFLTLRRNWGVGAIEWTEYILKHFKHTLRSAGIYGAGAVSGYRYHFDRNVWRAFCELWGPLTNTLYHGAGQVASLSTTWRELVAF